jgi:cold shock CspA family protein
MSFDTDIAAHIRALEQPWRQAERHQAEKPKAAPGKYTGIILRWSCYGYGFITPDQRIPELRDPELFVGARELRRSGVKHDLKHADRLRFDIKKVAQGRYEATNISLEVAS